MMMTDTRGVGVPRGHSILWPPVENDLVVSRHLPCSIEVNFARVKFRSARPTDP